MLKYITLILFIAIISSDVCQPNYWESDPQFLIPIKELEYVASKGISLTPIEQTKGLVPATKTTYNIQNITAVITYDDSQVNINRSDTSVTVSGVMLNFAISYHAESKNLLNSSKKYNGNATASFKGISVTYTKSAVIKDGVATFTITSSSISNTSQVTPKDDYNPPLADPSEFDSMIKTNLTNQIVSYYKTNIQALLTQAVGKTDNIPFTFKTQPYVYQFGDHNVSIKSTATNLSIGSKGYLIGYDGNVIGQQPDCSNFVPEKTTTASYITFSMISKIFNSFYTGNQGWQQMRIDQTNTKSSLFNFYMIDIEEILPQALVNFPKYFDRVYVNCSLNNTQPSFLNFLNEYKKINTTLAWQCGLFRAESNTNFLNFRVVGDYRVAITQINTALQVRIEYSRLSSVTFSPVDGYPLDNPNLAQMYIASVLSPFEGSVTVGSGFLQPKRNNPEFNFLDSNVLQITEKVNQKKHKMVTE